MPQVVGNPRGSGVFLWARDTVQCIGDAAARVDDARVRAKNSLLRDTGVARLQPIAIGVQGYLAHKKMFSPRTLQ